MCKCVGRILAPYGDNNKLRQMYSAKYSFFRGILMTSNLNANQAGGSSWGKGKHHDYPNRKFIKMEKTLKKKLYEFVSTLSVRRYESFLTIFFL